MACPDVSSYAEYEATKDWLDLLKKSQEHLALALDAYEDFAVAIDYSLIELSALSGACPELMTTDELLSTTEELSSRWTGVAELLVLWCDSNGWSVDQTSLIICPLRFNEQTGKVRAAFDEAYGRLNIDDPDSCKEFLDKIIPELMGYVNIWDPPHFDDVASGARLAIRRFRNLVEATGIPARERKSVFDPRDEFIYVEWNNGSPWQEIRQAGKAKGWQIPTSLPGIKSAAERYAKRKRLPPPTPRR